MISDRVPSDNRLNYDLGVTSANFEIFVFGTLPTTYLDVKLWTRRSFNLFHKIFDLLVLKT